LSHKYVREKHSNGNASARPKTYLLRRRGVSDVPLFERGRWRQDRQRDGGLLHTSRWHKAHPGQRPPALRAPLFLLNSHELG
jgi:hypothetical protein